MYGLLNSGLWKYNRTIWIAIPVYNFSLFLDECFKSINKQTYKNIHLCIFNDGSSDDSHKHITRWIPVLRRTGFVCSYINFTVNKGPGYTKWKAIEYIRVRARPTDIFTILDGDDYYLKEYSVELIVMEYLKSGCLFTYGSAEGENTNEGSKIVDFERKNFDVFPFQHPRSCVVHLLSYFTKEDFKDHLDNWAQRCSDRQFIYKCIELAGVKNISYIDEPLYYYRSHKDNVRNKIDNEYKNCIDNFVINKVPCKRLNDVLHIVMCSYKRQDNLAQIIESIDNQICENKIVFHIINTNVDMWETTVDIVKTTAVKNVDVRLVNANDNLYGYARFLYVKQLLKKEFIQNVVFIDDDQILKSDWIDFIYNKRTPFSYNCWHGRIFKRDGGQNISYWDSTMIYDDIVKNKSAHISEYEYGATSGALIDAQIFNFEIVYRCPFRFRMVEDLWLSYVVRHILGRPINRIMSTPVLDVESLYNKHNDDSLFLKIKETKQEFLTELVSTGFLIGETVKTETLNKLLSNDDSDFFLEGFTICDSN